MKYIISLNGKNYEVEVEQGKANIIKEEEISCYTPSPINTPVYTNEVSSSSEDAVKAPLSGVIVNIFVRPGQVVKHGDVLLVLEAMKMENELISPKDGVVSAILCTAGTNVTMGDPLIEIT